VPRRRQLAALADVLSMPTPGQRCCPIGHLPALPRRRGVGRTEPRRPGGRPRGSGGRGSQPARLLRFGLPAARRQSCSQSRCRAGWEYARRHRGPPVPGALAPHPRGPSRPPWRTDRLAVDRRRGSKSYPSPCLTPPVGALRDAGRRYGGHPSDSITLVPGRAYLWMVEAACRVGPVVDFRACAVLDRARGAAMTVTRLSLTLVPLVSSRRRGLPSLARGPRARAGLVLEIRSPPLRCATQ